MARQPTGEPVGAPKKPINWDQFEQLCGLQCTQSEIASMFKVDPDTIRERCAEHYREDYSVIYKRFSETGKCSLRRNQFVLSKKSATMGIWLGKQWLDQRDTLDVQVTPEKEQEFTAAMLITNQIQRLRQGAPEEKQNEDVETKEL